MKFRTTLLNGARWRAKGWSLPGVHDINAIYGTTRDFPTTTDPDEVKIRHYRWAINYAGIEQPDYRSWLNFERAHQYIKDWTPSQWRRWSAHMAAEYRLQMSSPFTGQILYDSAPDKDAWHQAQWDNTEELRIPNLACGSLYSGLWQAGNFRKLQVNADAGYDICVFVSHTNQTTKQTGTLVEFYYQIKMAVHLRAKYVVYWDGPVGTTMRAPDSRWELLHRIAGYLIEPKEILEW